MGILKAVGMGLGIVILKLLMPDVVSGFETALSAFFGAMQAIFVRLEYTVPA